MVGPRAVTTPQVSACWCGCTSTASAPTTSEMKIGPMVIPFCHDGGATPGIAVCTVARQGIPGIASTVAEPTCPSPLAPRSASSRPEGPATAWWQPRAPLSRQLTLTRHASADDTGRDAQHGICRRRSRCPPRRSFLTLTALSPSITNNAVAAIDWIPASSINRRMGESNGTIPPAPYAIPVNPTPNQTATVSGAIEVADIGQVHRHRAALR